MDKAKTQTCNESAENKDSSDDENKPQREQPVCRSSEEARLEKVSDDCNDDDCYSNNDVDHGNDNGQIINENMTEYVYEGNDVNVDVSDDTDLAVNGIKIKKSSLNFGKESALYHKDASERKLNTSDDAPGKLFEPENDSFEIETQQHDLKINRAQVNSDIEIYKRIHDNDDDVKVTNNLENATIDKPIYCDPCRYDDSLEIATGFCITCTEYLCQGCCRDHKKNKLTREHNILKDDNIPNDIAPFRAIRHLMKCQTHSENEVAYECMDHKRLICVSCFTESHRKCDQIVDLGTREMDVLAEAAEFSLVSELRDRLIVCTQRKDETADIINSRRDEIKQECDDLKDRWAQHIEELGSLLQTEVDANANSEIKSAEESKSECIMMQKDLDEHRDIVSVLKLHGSKKETAVVSKMLSEKMNMYQLKIQAMESERPKQLILRKTDPHVELPAIGNINTDVPAGASVKFKKLTSQVDNGTPYKIRTTTDTNTCSIIAITAVFDERFAVADQGNNKLKLFSRNFEPIAEKYLPGAPSDMCGRGNNLFLCFPDLKKINSYGQFNPIYERFSYSTLRHPVSVSMVDEERLMILFKIDKSLFCSNDIMLEIRKGNSIQATLELFEDDDFETIRAAARIFRIDNSSIILAENERISCYKVKEFSQYNLLLCMKRAWYYTSTKEKPLNTPRGLCMDQEGNVYVCGEGSNNVHQISARNFSFQNGQVLVDGIKRPLSVLVDGDRITVGCRHDDFLHVYRFI